MNPLNQYPKPLNKSIGYAHSLPIEVALHEPTSPFQLGIWTTMSEGNLALSGGTLRQGLLPDFDPSN